MGIVGSRSGTGHSNTRDAQQQVSKANGLSLLLVHRAIDEAQQKPSAGEEVTPSSRAVLDWTYSKSLPVVKIEKAKV